MMTEPHACAVVFVSDVARMRDFYEQVVSMKIASQDADHAVLSLPGFELVIHKLSYEPEASCDAEGNVLIREDAYIKICLPVPSISAARETAKALGGGVQDASREWEARGFRACDGYDPEGNVFQVRESIADEELSK